MYRRQPHLPVDVTLGLALHSVTAPKTLKFVQKLREHVQWAHKKAKSFQAKEAWHKKLNYDNCSRAAALEVGDTVLVCVTAFKACHKNKTDGKTESMWWKGGPIPMYQSL